MACPVCGGTSRRQIAPNYWECSSVIYGQVAIGLDPSGVHGPPIQNVARRCGHRYQEGSAMCDGLTCAFCTLFAVGRCGDCGEPVCGDCGRRYGVAFLCKRCRDGREHAKAQAEADRLQIAAEAREAKARADAEAGARDLEARAEWLRQLARALASAGVKTNHGKGWKVSERTKSSQWVDRTNGVQYDFSSPSFTMDIRSQVALTRGGMLIAEVQTKRAGVRTWQPAKIVDATKTTSFNNVRDYVQKSYRVQFPTFAEFSKTL